MVGCKHILLQDLTWIEHIYESKNITNKIGNFPDYLGFTMDAMRGNITNIYDKHLGINIEYFPGF